MNLREYFLPFLPKKKVEETGPRYADANDRCFAAVIDVALLYLLLSSVTPYFSHAIYAHFGMDAPADHSRQFANYTELRSYLWEIRYPWLLENLSVFLLMGVLVSACYAAYGTTPGKRLLGMRIVDARTLQPIGLARFILRFLAYIPACLPVMIGLFWMSFNKQRRAWQDYIAGTVVIYTRPKGWLWHAIKRGVKRLRGRSAAVEEAVGEPSAEQRHQDGNDTVG